MSTILGILAALGALLVLAIGIAALDTWMQRRHYDAWTASLGCPGCGTDRCTCDDAEEWR